MSVRTILFHAAIQSENFGDVLLAQIILSWVREVTDAQIVATGVAERVSTYLNLPEATWRSYLASDAFILSGGAFFNFPPAEAAFREKVRFFYRNSWPILFALLIRKPTAIIGVGAGNARHPFWRAVAWACFSGARVASVRDEGSWEAIHQLELEKCPAKGADSVFYLRSSDLPSSATNFATKVMLQAENRRTIGIQLSATPERSPKYASLYTIIEKSLKQYPDAVLFAIEDHPVSRSGQQATQEHLLRTLGPERCVIVRYPGAFELTALLARLDTVITDKLHVGLVAAAMGTPPFSIAKHPKNLAAYRELGLEEHCVMLDSASVSDLQRVVEASFAANGRFEVPANVRAGALQNRKLVQEFVAGYVAHPA